MAENHMDTKMDNEMETATILGHLLYMLPGHFQP